jgi:streptogramin lyase
MRRQTLGYLGLRGSVQKSLVIAFALAFMFLALVVPLEVKAVPNLLVSSFGDDEIKRYDGTSGAFIDTFASGGGLDGPRALVFGPDGNLYVSGVNSDSLRYDGSTGAFVDVFVADGTGGLDQPVGLAFGPDGNLYVANNPIGPSTILRYDGGTGAFIDTFASGGGLSGANGLVFGPDGSIYVTSLGTDQVLRYNGSTGAFVDVFASGGGLDQPTGLVFGPDSNLYVSSSFNSQILRYNGGNGAFVDIFASGGGLSVPRGLVFGPDGNLYVTSLFTDEVLRYNGGTGAFVDVFASGGGLDGPTYLTFTAAVPEPSSVLLLLGSALAGLGAFAWRRRIGYSTLSRVAGGLKAGCEIGLRKLRKGSGTALVRGQRCTGGSASAGGASEAKFWPLSLWQRLGKQSGEGALGY